MKFLYNPSTDAPFNLALEELAAEYFEEDIFMLWRNRSAVIVGRNQNTAAEVDSDYAKAHECRAPYHIQGDGFGFARSDSDTAERTVQGTVVGCRPVSQGRPVGIGRGKGSL